VCVALLLLRVVGAAGGGGFRSDMRETLVSTFHTYVFSRYNRIGRVYTAY
jgi:hypothetical protein